MLILEEITNVPHNRTSSRPEIESIDSHTVFRESSDYNYSIKCNNSLLVTVMSKTTGEKVV